MKTEPSEETTITIKFANADAAYHFALWLSGAGEKDYRNWMAYREDEEDGDITAVKFHYHGEEDKTKDINDPRRYGKFMCDNIIRTTIGRLDK